MPMTTRQEFVVYLSSTLVDLVHLNRGLPGSAVYDLSTMRQLPRFGNARIVPRLFTSALGGGLLNR
jgi:hypothetical protein